MLQETMKMVEEAESKADGIIKDANEKADSIIADAENRASQIIADAHATAKAGLRSVEDSRKDREEELVNKSLEDAATEIGSLKKIAAERENKAIDMIVDELI
jgi:vacuolar-type H+-ATPase subunit H